MGHASMTLCAFDSAKASSMAEREMLRNPALGESLGRLVCPWASKTLPRRDVSQSEMNQPVRAPGNRGDKQPIVFLLFDTPQLCNLSHLKPQSFIA